MLLCWLVTWSFMSSCKELVVVLSYIDKLYRRPFTKSWLSWNNSDFWRYWEGTVNFALSFTNKFNPNDGTFLFHLNYIYFRQRLPFDHPVPQNWNPQLCKRCCLDYRIDHKGLFTFLFHAGSMTIDVGTYFGRAKHCIWVLPNPQLC